MIMNVKVDHIAFRNKWISGVLVGKDSIWEGCNLQIGNNMAYPKLCQQLVKLQNLGICWIKLWNFEYLQQESAIIKCQVLDYQYVVIEKKGHWTCYTIAANICKLPYKLKSFWWGVTNSVLYTWRCKYKPPTMYCFKVYRTHARSTNQMHSCLAAWSYAGLCFSCVPRLLSLRELMNQRWELMNQRCWVNNLL